MATWLLLGLLVFGMSGCAGLEERVAAMNDRQVTSCIYVFGFPYPFIAWRSITATGGATIDLCHNLR